MQTSLFKVTRSSVEEFLSSAPPGAFEDAEENSSPRHFKMMCNVDVNRKRSTRNSPLSKSIVDACAKDGIHLSHAFGENGEVWRCYEEAMIIQPGDIAHMYYGDLSKNNSKHYVGTVLTTYEKFSTPAIPDEFSAIKKVWIHDPMYAIFCKVDWKEVPMTTDDEYMLKNPGKNGFKVQGTILRVK